MPQSDSTPPGTERFTFSIIPEWVLDHEGLSHGAVRLYGILARYADKDGVSWASRTTLAKRLRCSRATVDRWAAELVKVKALTITRRKAEGKKENLTNLWTIHRVDPSVRPPSRKSRTRIGPQKRQRTRTIELDPKKGTSLLDDLIRKESSA